MELVRADALRNYPRIVAELGGNADALLRQFRIPKQAIEAGDEYISFRAMIRLLEHSAEVLACRDFGMRIGQQQDFDMFGPVALAAQNCGTFGEAIDCVSRYFYTHNPSTQITLEARRGKRVRLCVRLLLPNPPPHRQIQERNAVLGLNGLQLLSAGNCKPLRIYLPHAAIAPRSSYRQALSGHSLRFERDCVAIYFKASELQLPIRGCNAQLRKVATVFLESQRKPQQSGLRARVRETIKPLLPSGRCNQVNLADALYLHPRTLQRRLTDEGTSFEALKEEVRREVAEYYLKDSAMPLSQVASLLGYSEQSALTRSCRRWFGRAPLALRRERSQSPKP